MNSKQGLGQLSHTFLMHGHDVFSIDIMPGFIKKAIEDIPDISGTATFLQADAFDYVTPVPCDLAINWWTSFGLFKP